MGGGGGRTAWPWILKPDGEISCLEFIDTSSHFLKYQQDFKTSLFHFYVV